MAVGRKSTANNGGGALQLCYIGGGPRTPYHAHPRRGSRFPPRTRSLAGTKLASTDLAGTSVSTAHCCEIRRSVPALQRRSQLYSVWLYGVFVL
eukprot:2405422-Rhodomonas_salina.1